MASPLNWIRKRQRFLMGAFGVVLIFTFTVSLGSGGYDPLIDFISGRGWEGSKTAPVVFQSDWGKLNESDLDRLRVQRIAISDFLKVLSYEASQRGAQPTEMRCNDQRAEANLVELYVLANEAKQRGLTITNEEIMNYLAGLTEGRVEEHEYAGIWQAVTKGRFSEIQLFEMLRFELLAHRFRQLAMSGAGPGSPVQVWDLFNRLERRLTVELFGVPVDDFLARVEVPTQAELKAFYAEHKDDYPDPSNGIPGFKKREKRAFSFLKFDFETLLTLETAKITEQQIAEYYEQNKELFIRTDLPASDLKPAAGENTPSESEKAASAEQAAPPSDAVPTGDAVPSADGVPAEDAVPAVDNAPSTETPAPVPQPTPSPLPQESGDAAASTPVKPKSGVPDESRYQPLEEVKEECRRGIAIPLVQTMLDTLMASVNRELAKYQQQMMQWESRRQRDSKGAKPALPDFAKLSPDFELKVESIELVDSLGIAEFPIGRSFDMIQRDQGSIQLDFAQVAFQPNQGVYEVTQFPTAPREWPKYIFWVTEIVESTTLSFAEAREEVVRDFNRSKAFELALVAAKEEADKARQSGTSLEEACVKEGRVFVPSVDVRWMASLALPTAGGLMPDLGTIDGVDGVSEEMMREICRLAVGEVGIAANGPKTEVYVVRVISEGPNPEVRRERFMREGGASQDLQFLALREMYSNRNAWFMRLWKANHAKWNRDPRPESRSR